MSRSFHRFATTLIAALAIALTGCGAMNAQNPSEGYRPVNATPDAEGTALMLKGFDVVNYFSAGKHAMGDKQFRSVYKGVTFQFASSENKALFEKEPTKYLPQYGGYCANGIVYGIPWGGDGDTWRMIDGKLYIFGGAGSRDAFLLDQSKNIELADKYWKDEVNGNNSFVQRNKRLVFRVDHYKSGEELARMVNEAKKAGKLQ
jgi:YHS domain-containing protein